MQDSPRTPHRQPWSLSAALRAQKISLLILFAFTDFFASASLHDPAQRPVKLDDIISPSDYVIHGRVKTAASKWVNDDRGTHIYTYASMECIEYLKGSGSRLATIEFPGGTVDGITEYVSHSPSAYVGEEMVMSVKTGSKGLVPAAGIFSKLSVNSGIACGLVGRMTIESIRARLAGLPAEIISEGTEPPVQTEAVPSIISIAPSSASAGTASPVTITGANFGSLQGSGKVNFFYRSGQPTISAPVISWSDTSITCTVPVGIVSGYPASASSGPVTVTNGSGSTSNSRTFAVTFGYGEIKWTGDWPVIPYVVNENCRDCEGEGAALDAAANTWNNAGAHFAFQYAGTHSKKSSSRDDLNELMWGNAPFSIATTTFWYSGSELLECDIVFNENSYTWDTSGSPSSSEMDVQTIAVHELGHWLHLRDLYGNIGDGLNDNGKIMYGFGNYGLLKRDLTAADHDAIIWIYGQAAPASYTISGRVTCDGQGLDDVAMSGLPGTPITSGGGYYSAEVDSGFSAPVIPVKSQYTFEPNSITYSNVTADQNDQDYNAQLLTYTISGQVTFDANGLADVNMVGLGVLTDSNGYYAANVPSGWSGTVTPTKAEYAFEPNSVIYSNTTSAYANQDFAASLVHYTISGRITLNDAALADVNMLGLGVATDGNGYYTTEVLSGWSGTVTPTKAEYTFEPNSIAYVNVTSNWLDQDYTAAHLVAPIITSVPPIEASIGQLYAYDANSLGIPDPNWTLLARPFGMTIDANTGLTQWTPDVNQLGDANVTVKAENAAGSAIQEFTIAVSLSDNFNDNRRSAMWRLLIDDPNMLCLVEDSNRLNLLSTKDSNNLAAFYMANGWSFDANEDFAARVDFHYDRVTLQDGWVTLSVESAGGYASISAGSDANESCFYYETIVDGNLVMERQPRDSNDGTLYISYDADSNSLYLSHVGFGSDNSYTWQYPNAAAKRWTSDVNVVIGGGSDDTALNSCDAWLDNLKLTRGRLLGWPPATDLDTSGFIELDDVRIMSDYWLADTILDPNTKGDLNGDGIVNLADFTELALPW